MYWFCNIYLLDLFIIFIYKGTEHKCCFRTKHHFTWDKFTKIGPVESENNFLLKETIKTRSHMIKMRIYMRFYIKISKIRKQIEEKKKTTTTKKQKNTKHLTFFWFCFCFACRFYRFCVFYINPHFDHMGPVFDGLDR